MAEKQLTEIRADLWETMNSSQLSRQQELILSRLSTLQKMMPGTESTIGMYKALDHALNIVTELIETRNKNNKNFI